MNERPILEPTPAAMAGDPQFDDKGNLRFHQNIYAGLPEVPYPRGVIPEALRLPRAASLKPGENDPVTYTEDKLVQAFCIYASEVNKAKQGGQFHLDAQAHALARLFFLIEPAAAVEARSIILQTLAATKNGIYTLAAEEQMRQRTAERRAARAKLPWWRRWLGI